MTLLEKLQMFSSVLVSLASTVTMLLYAGIAAGKEIKKFKAKAMKRNVSRPKFRRKTPLGFGVVAVLISLLHALDVLGAGEPVTNIELFGVVISIASGIGCLSLSVSLVAISFATDLLYKIVFECMGYNLDIDEMKLTLKPSQS